MAFSGVSFKQIIPTFLLRAVFAPVILGLFACVAVPTKLVAVTVLSSILTLSIVALPLTSRTPSTVVLSKVVAPLTSRFLPTERVEPSKVKLLSSSSSPSLPAITTLSFVRSSTFNEFI